MRVPMLLLALAAAPLPAAVAAEGPRGLTCGFEDDTGTKIPEDEAHTGKFSAGPLLGTGTVTCSIQNDAGLHSGPDLAGASASGEDVVGLPPTRVWYSSPDHLHITVCTAFTPVGGPTLYWSPELPRGRWTTDPESPCESGGLVGLVDDVFVPVDAAICPVLAGAAPTLSGLGVPVEPDGDLPVWDCPPYGDQ